MVDKDTIRIPFENVYSGISNCLEKDYISVYSVVYLVFRMAIGLSIKRIPFPHYAKPQVYTFPRKFQMHNSALCWFAKCNCRKRDGPLFHAHSCRQTLKTCMTGKTVTPFTQACDPTHPQNAVGVRSDKQKTSRGK